MKRGNANSPPTPNSYQEILFDQEGGLIKKPTDVSSDRMLENLKNALFFVWAQSQMSKDKRLAGSKSDV